MAPKLRTSILLIGLIYISMIKSTPISPLTSSTPLEQIQLMPPSSPRTVTQSALRKDVVTSTLQKPRTATPSMI
ncbi:hypothetical protein M3Y96_00672900 [Aphelenchoides besseyi]|nr:hypothetical protein M3Y96_00672900 [Aphelenchoides besseyi]